MASSVVSWMVLSIFMAISTTQVKAAARAFFVFGDYLVDNGNNNYLSTTARADSPPYGIDTSSHRPTGRFSNGKNIPDFISDALGSEPTLPYLSPELNGDKLLVVPTSLLLVLESSMTLESNLLADLAGEDEAQRIVNDACVLITVGGNDFVNNYYLVPFSARSRQFNLPDYVRYLISESTAGSVTRTGPLGCVPAELAMRSLSGQCDPELQRAAALYNPQLVEMINGLNGQLATNIFIAANTPHQTNDFISNPGAYGFTTSKIACCGQAPYNGLGLCTPLSNLCPNRDEYVFWDPFHPSERANGVIVDMILKGSAEHMSPMNLSTFLALDTTTTT
ncbi:GDSL esterase/lipase [Hibiscus syriacus]|uniref:GDSL esterase/lipase n=1 Tax=Hibiscus syriacus TaxID=106335 RepID=A0A6A3B370_HIBSY|nr:GDSL esterase/lipase [Hibiscus syriacus]